jgi:hypothetical protein
MASKPFVTVALTALLLVQCPGPGDSAWAQTPASGCLRDGLLSPDVLLCDDFENPEILPVWDIGSNGASWPNADFVVCGDGLGYGDRCAAWSNRLIFDTFWGFWGYDAWRSFTPQNEFYVRWYQYISDPYTWGTLEDKSVMLHSPPDASITAYVATNRNEWPAVPDSGPGMPFVANYQDLDWPETGGQYTKVNRFQNQGNDITLQPGRWYLFEWYVKLNTPGASDGVTRLWVDDASAPVSTQTLRLEYDDMRWRRSGDAGKQFGFLRLTVYHQRCDSDPNSCPPNGPAILDQWQRWDHVVVSRHPVGPLPLAPVCGAAYPILRPAWPPNRKFVVVTIGGVTDPRQQPLTITIASVTRDDPAGQRRARHHAHHDDDSDHEPVIRGDTVFVPVEHKGNDAGPEYRVDFSARNTDGLECTGSVRIPTFFRTPHPHK